MSINTSKFKTTAPHSRNLVYQKEIHVGCFFCNRDDKRCKKIYTTLYSLFQHFCHDHKNEYDYMKKIVELAELIIEGSLR